MGLLPGVTDRRGDGSGSGNYLVGQPQARLDMLDDDCAVTVLNDGLTQHFKIFIFQYDLLVVLLHPQIKRADSQIGFFPVRISRIDLNVPELETKEHLIPGQKTQVIIIIDTKVSAGCDVSNAHRVIPHNETAGPFRPRKFQSPQ